MLFISRDNIVWVVIILQVWFEAFQRKALVKRKKSRFC